jgi:hypothetical protein
MKKYLFQIIFFFSISFSKLICQELDILSVSQEEELAKVSIRLTSKEIIHISPYDIIEFNNEFTNFIGMNVRRFICIYKSIDAANYQLILTNWYFGPVYEYLMYTRLIYSNPPPITIEFSGSKDINIVFPTKYENSTKKNIKSIKVYFFYNVVARDNYQILEQEIECDLIVFDDRKIYWNNITKPLETIQNYFKL